jgi:hypothetical protein
MTEPTALPEKPEKDPLTGAANKMREEFAKELSNKVAAQMKIVKAAADVYRTEKIKLWATLESARIDKKHFDETMKDMAA